MKEVLQQIELGLTGFPPLTGRIIITGFGAVSGLIIMALKSKKRVPAWHMAGHIFVGWMTGIFGSALVGSAFTSQSMAGYFSGLGGYVAARNYSNEKESSTKEPEVGSEP